MAVIKGTINVDTLSGTTEPDQISGLAGADILRGLDGNDTIDGGAGNDTMYGGAGNDVFIVDSIGDKVIELAAEGVDLVKASISFTLGAFVEQLLLTGAAAINGTGNALANTLTGNGANNTLIGLAGNDVLKGGAGADVLIGGTGLDQMTGGSGNDRFVFDDGDFASKTSSGADVIVDFTAGDKIEHLTVRLFGALLLAQVGGVQNRTALMQQMIVLRLLGKRVAALLELADPLRRPEREAQASGCGQNFHRASGRGSPRLRRIRRKQQNEVAVEVGEGGRAIEGHIDAVERIAATKTNAAKIFDMN